MISLEMTQEFEMTPLEMVREFHERMGCRINEIFSWDLLKERYRLILEEFREFSDEWWAVNPDKERIAKELADLVYVVYGAAVNIGIDLDRAVELVHQSNMSKLVDGKPIIDENGKVLKGPNYIKPDMSKVV